MSPDNKQAGHLEQAATIINYNVVMLSESSGSALSYCIRVYIQFPSYDEEVSNNLSIPPL